MKGREDMAAMKWLLVFFAFLLLFSLAAALEFELAKPRIQKGESIEISGSSEGFTRVKVEAQNGHKEVFRGGTRSDQNGFFSFSIGTTCSDPAGYWDVIIEDQKGEEKKGLVFVESSHECGFYAITFTSPSPSKYGRTSVFDITVKVEDNKVPVKNALVYFWGVDGERTVLYPMGGGVYSYSAFEVPFDAPLGQWDLTVTASKKAGLKYVGGENSIVLELDKVALDFEVIKPKVREFQYGSVIKLEVKPVYPNKASVEDAVVEVEVLGKKHRAEKGKKGVYSFSLSTKELENELVTFLITVQDQAGNTGSKTITLTPVGYWVYFLQNNAVFYVFPALFLVYVLFLSSREVGGFFVKARLKRRRKKLAILMKKLQDDYFNRRLISHDLYSQQAENYETEMDEIESKLAELERKQKIR